MPTRMIAAALVLFVGCGTPAAPKTGQPNATLDQMLAPIALYPDQLLAQMLMSATDPGKVTELNKWLKANQKLKGTQLQDAAVKAGFEPSFVALALFPQVVATMADQIGWTKLLGQSFTSDRNAVFDSIQRLRQQARNVGTLKSSPQQEVETKTTSTGQQVIVIEPTNPQIVYVPQYNTEVVYTQAPSTTVVVQENNDAGVAVAAGLIGFTAGIAIGAAMDNNYYYGPYGWRGGAYMYNDAWDDYYDHREDAREDWIDHREDLADERSDRVEDRSGERSDRAESTQEQRTDRQQTRQENRPESQGQGAQRATPAQTPTQGATAQTPRSDRTQATTADTPRSDRTQAATADTPRSDRTQAATADTPRSDRTQATTAQTQRPDRTGSTEARGYGGSESPAVSQRSSGGSDAFSGYSSGASQRSSSDRGQRSRSSSRGGGGGGRRR